MRGGAGEIKIEEMTLIGLMRILLDRKIKKKHAVNSAATNE
jgi:hypothetical protein